VKVKESTVLLPSAVFSNALESFGAIMLTFVELWTETQPYNIAIRTPMKTPSAS